MTDPMGGGSSTACGPIEGVRWHEDGYCTLSGSARLLFDAIDRRLSRLCRRWADDEIATPPLIPAEPLRRLGYFDAFPQLATHVGYVDPSAPGDAVRLVSSGHLLTPAACYHLYDDLGNGVFAAPVYKSVAGSCFRAEARFEPLVRQWAFRMREIVCIAPADTIEDFSGTARDAVSGLLEELDLQHTWRVATDPFFGGSRNPLGLMQRIAPSKWEAQLDNGVALASLNHHRRHFTEPCNIQVAGRAAHSACLAFGVDRWLYALCRRHGPGWTHLVDQLDASGL